MTKQMRGVPRRRLEPNTEDEQEDAHRECEWYQAGQGRHTEPRPATGAPLLPWREPSPPPRCPESSCRTHPQ
jgi:hypothetical protein